jgi:hypothetical protein
MTATLTKLSQNESFPDFKIYFPMMLIAILVPYIKIYWMIQKQNLIRSIYSSIKYLIKHPIFVILAGVIQYLYNILSYILNLFIAKPYSTIFLAALAILMRLTITSASVVYFKSIKGNGDKLQPISS